MISIATKVINLQKGKDFKKNDNTKLKEFLVEINKMIDNLESHLQRENKS